MTTYTIKTQACNNAYGVCFEVWQDDVVHIGIFTRRFWAEAWIADMLADPAESRAGPGFAPGRHPHARPER